MRCIETDGERKDSVMKVESTITEEDGREVGIVGEETGGVLEGTASQSVRR